MAGKQSGKDKKNDVGVEDEEVNDTNVKTLSLDFECGQRVLSQVHILCQVFRDQTSKAMKGLKSQEYQLAKEEVVKLQAQIDAKRIEQIERISGTQSRQLTALEKARLLQLQSMQKADSKAADRFITTPFADLLNEESDANPFVGVQVESIIESIVTPLCEAVCLEVDKLYTVNQKLMKLAALCRQETLKHQKKIQDLETRLLELKRQGQQDSVDLTRLQKGVQMRNNQLRVIRESYEKEVIAVKVMTANAVTRHTGVDEIVDKASKAFTAELLPEKLGPDATGQDLDQLLFEYTSKLQKQLSQVPTEPLPNAAGTRINDETFDLQIRLMKLENELAQQQIKNMVLRQGMENWRAFAKGIQK